MKEPNHSTRVSRALLSGLIAALCLTAAAPIQAQNTTQAITFPDEASLRAAVGGGGVVNLAFDGTLTLANTIKLERDVTLDGSGHAVTISGGNAVRLFIVAAGVHARFINLTLADGRYLGTNAYAANPAGEPAYGGAVCNQGGTVDFLDCTLSGNTVQGGTGVTHGGEAIGGAVYNLAGILNITNTLFFSNRATGGYTSFFMAGMAFGGALYNQDGQVNLDHAEFAQNNATGGRPISETSGSGYGGGVHSSGGTVVVRQCTFSGNQAGSLGNGEASGGGGAISVTNAFLTCTDSQFLGNRAQGVNGLHYGSGEGLGGALFSLGEMILNGCLFRDNIASGPLNLARDQLHGNGKGGAVYAHGSLSVTGCTFVENLAQGGDGLAVTLQRPPFNGGLGLGGGIYSEGMLHLTNSTFFSNAARGGNGILASDIGTSAGGPGLGGGVYYAASSADFLNVTMAANAAAGGTGVPAGASLGGAIYNAGTLWLGNSILASSASGGNYFGRMENGGHNLSSDVGFADAHSFGNTDPKLGPLADNGGPTLTMALLAGSPAIDAGDDTLAPAFDQRGVRRPQGAHADMGAFEFIDERVWILQFSRAANGWQIRFNGRPNANYVILRASSLDGPWTACGTAAAINGQGEFLDPDPLVGSAFYRLEEQ